VAPSNCLRHFRDFSISRKRYKLGTYNLRQSMQNNFLFVIKIALEVVFASEKN